MLSLRSQKKSIGSFGLHFYRQSLLVQVSWNWWVSWKSIQDLVCSLIQLTNVLKTVFHSQLSWLLGWFFSVSSIELWEWELVKGIMEHHQNWTLMVLLNMLYKPIEIQLEMMQHQLIHTGMYKMEAHTSKLSCNS